MIISEIAQTNYQALCTNPYPGRGIVVGTQPDGNVIMVTWIMGRSPNSRNRIYSRDDWGRVYTEAADPTAMKDPSLIIYNAMNERDDLFVASNGNQTDTVIEAAGTQTLHDVLFDEGTIYEPDEPNFTPRITASVNAYEVFRLIEFEILKRSRWSPSCDRQSFIYEMIEKGFGLCVTTYTGDGNPLPPFEGEPYLLPIPEGGCEYVAGYFWEALNRDNRVAIAAKEINLVTIESRVAIVNRYSKIEATVPQAQAL